MSETTINPVAITNFERTDDQLESFWLFCMFVAGKNSDFASKCLASLLNKAKDLTPFQYLKQLSEVSLHNALVACRIGQYIRLEKGITQSFDVDLRGATLEELMGVYGVGPKTARFFMLHTRRDCKHAVLDTHILKWMASYIDHGHSATPQNQKEYRRLEEAFFPLARAAYPKLSIAEIDLIIWSKMSGRLD